MSKIEIAPRWDETLPCVECGGWNARWSSVYAGHVTGDDEVVQEGDLKMYCRDCSRVYDVALADWSGVSNLVRMSPGEDAWRDRKVWWHCGSSEWETECPNDAYVHVGTEQTSRWLDQLEGRDTLYRVEVIGEMPRRLIRDQVSGWKNRTCAYVNSWEFPGNVSLYLPKNRLRVIGREELI